MLVPLLVMAVVVGGIAAALYYRGGSEDSRAAKRGVTVQNPFSLWAAAKFGACLPWSCSQ